MVECWLFKSLVTLAPVLLKKLWGLACFGCVPDGVLALSTVANFSTGTDTAGNAIADSHNTTQRNRIFPRLESSRLLECNKPRGLVQGHGPSLLRMLFHRLFPTIFAQSYRRTWLPGLPLPPMRTELTHNPRPEIHVFPIFMFLFHNSF